VISLDGKITRGTTPNTWRIRLPHDAPINAYAGTLRFVSDSGAVTLVNCIPDLSTLRTEHHDGKREWVLLLRDRRATWPGKPVSGRYNKRYRNNSIDPATRKTASEIADLVMGALSESNGNSLPATYPDIDWEDIGCNKALDELLSLLPGHVCRDTDDSYSVKTTGQGDGIDSGWPAIIPDYLARVESGPKTVRVKPDRTWFGAALKLEAVGIEDNGTYEPLASLSYTPSGGWEDEWPGLFTGVNPGPNRQRAYESVFRCYRVKVPQTLNFGGDSFTISSLDDIELDDRRVIWKYADPPPAYVTGEYWPMGDHPYNTANCPNVACDWTMDKGNRLIRFEYPIFRIGNCVQAADLKLHTGFRLRDSATKEWDRELFDIDRGEGEGIWVLEVPHLWRARAVGYNDCSVATDVDNISTLRSEAMVYAQAWVDHFDAIRDKRHVSVAGIHPVSTTGNIASVKFRVGRGQTPATFVSQNFEARTQ
jgi:hypothetical protein